MTTCKECKFYTPNTYKNFGDCSRWHASYSINPATLATNEVITEADEGWGSYMGPDFGCVLWESK